MNELKYLFVVGLIPLAFFTSIELATFIAIIGLLVWLLFFNSPNKEKQAKTPQKGGNSKTDETIY